MLSFPPRQQDYDFLVATDGCIECFSGSKELLNIFCTRSYSRSDLGLKEDENENQ